MAEFKNISVTELPELITGGKVQLVDVRTDAEIARGRIKGAISLPLHLLPLRLGELDANKTTVFYCQMGGRSAQAAAFAAAAARPSTGRQGSPPADRPSCDSGAARAWRC